LWQILIHQHILTTLSIYGALITLKSVKCQ
jgi:hypothetical protein